MRKHSGFGTNTLLFLKLSAACWWNVCVGFFSELPATWWLHTEVGGGGSENSSALSWLAASPPEPLEYIFLAFSTWSAIMREFSRESRCWLKHAGLQPRDPRQEAQLIFFPRMYIKASYASGGTSSGNCRDSPHEQDDDIVFIVFLFFFPSLDLQALPPFLNPHIKLPAKYCWLNKI